MRKGRRTEPFPVYPIAPVLAHYGFDGVHEGKGWRAVKCAFHGDITASASVNTIEQVFNCHAAACPRGNAVQIVMQKEGLSYSEALQRTAEILGGCNAPVPEPPGRRSRLAGRTRNRSGVRSVTRTWRST